MDEKQERVQPTLFLPTYVLGWIFFGLSLAYLQPFLLGMAIMFMFHGFMKNVSPFVKNDDGGNDSNE